MKSAALVGLSLAAWVSLAGRLASAQTYAPAPDDGVVVQPNGDVDRFPFMVHMPIGLSFAALPFGSLDGSPGTALGDNAGTITSFELGGGARVGRYAVDLMFAIGGSGVHGPLEAAFRAQGFDPGIALRFFFGLDGAYYLARTATWAPWIGGRLGYEYLGFTADRGSINSSISYGGPYLALRGGSDLRLTEGFGVGAYVELGLGRFVTGSADVYPDDDPLTLVNESVSERVTTDIDRAGGAFHGYLGLGLRLVIFP